MDTKSPSDELLKLLGDLVVGAGDYGKYRGSSGAALFVKAGWTVTDACPYTGWESWATEQIRLFLRADPAAVDKLLIAMASPSEFLDKVNRVLTSARRKQVDIWNGFLAPHGLRIAANPTSATVERISRGFLPADDPEADLPSPATPEEILPLVRKLKEHYPTRCVFIMLQMGNTAPSHKMVEMLKLSLESRGLIGLIATDCKFTDLLWRNIQTYMHGCAAGIAVFDRLENDNYNANVALEAGYMIALGKPVGFFKERTMTGLQSDLAGHIWYSFDVHKSDSIAQCVDKWLRHEHLVTET